MDLKVYELEKNHLSETIVKLVKARGELDTAMETLGEANLDQLKEMRNSPDTSAADFLMFVQQLHEKNEAFNIKDKIKRLEEFDYLIKEPYFARIDLSDSHEEKSFYIGKFGYTEDVPVVVDWRAKVASIYYRYRFPQKNVKYHSPDGEIVKDLTLKRTFEIDNSELVKFYNNDIQLDEGQIIADKITERTGGVLEDIVETIQESQLDIIESDPRQVCVVQGCVGSGKSTVAIHKLSHIFFNYPNIIQPERSILVAKSGILVSYLATLFPKLGIFDINYKTLRELVYNLLFREGIHLRFDLDDTGNLSAFDLNKINKLRSRLKEVHVNVDEKIQKILEHDDFVSLASYVHDDRLSIAENMNDLVSDLNEELSYQKERLKEHPNSVKSWIYKENIQNIRKLLNKLQKVQNELKDKFLPEICKELDIPIKETSNYTHILVYLFIHAELFGFPNSLKYQYCVVDEGQDFSLLEYLILGKLVLNGRFCVLGDLNQSYIDEGLSDWESIKNVIDEAKDAQTFQLNTNYRSTKQIIDFANSVLRPYTKTFLPKSIERVGPEVTQLSVSSDDLVIEQLESYLATDIKELNKSIGVIVFGDDLLLRAQDLLDKLGTEFPIEPERIIKLEEHTRIAYIPKGLYITKFDYCKGLEFAKVYVLGLNLKSIKSFTDAKRAFVAVTRAMNELIIIENSH